jgi:hypothetical protein
MLMEHYACTISTPGELHSPLGSTAKWHPMSHSQVVRVVGIVLVVNMLLN